MIANGCEILFLLFAVSSKLDPHCTRHTQRTNKTVASFVVRVTKTGNVAGVPVMRASMRAAEVCACIVCVCVCVVAALLCGSIIKCISTHAYDWSVCV